MGTNERKRRLLIRQVALVIILLAVAGGLFANYLSRHSEAGIVRAHFVAPSGARTPDLLLRVADTEAKRRKGLMYVRELPANHGMLFVYPAESDHQFWMKNTLVSLDIIFISSDFKVVGVLKDMPVLDESQRGVGKPSRHVVEVPAGTAARYGIVNGSLFKSGSALPTAQ